VKIVADENVDKPIVDRLRIDGHEVYFVAELNAGIDDDFVLMLSHEKDAILLTADRDFGDLVFRQGLVHAGIMLIRLAGLQPDDKANLIAAVFKEHGKDLSHGFSVLTNRSLRIRRRLPA